MSLLATACGNPPGVETANLPTLTLTGTSTGLPLSQNDDVALIAEGRACAIDSYATQVVCVEPDSQEPEVFGREGEGPGEFFRISDLTRGPEGAVIVRDALQRRLSVVPQDGSLHDLVRVPPTWKLLRADSFPLIGYVSQPSPVRDFLSVAVLNLDLNGNPVGDTIFIRISSALPLPPSAPVPGLARSENGEFAAWGGDYHLLWFDPSGQLATAFTSPRYRAELPNQRDREVDAETYRVLFGIHMPPALADSLANRPKVPLVPGDPLRFDSRGRLWVATTVDRESMSYLDVFDHGLYLGSVPVRDRLLGFDILDSTLVVLAERRAPGSADLPRRELDWYRIRRNQTPELRE